MIDKHFPRIVEREKCKVGQREPTGKTCKKAYKMQGE